MSHEIRVFLTVEAEARLKRLSDRVEANNSQVIRDALRIYEQVLDTNPLHSRRDQAIPTARSEPLADYAMCDVASQPGDQAASNAIRQRAVRKSRRPSQGSEGRGRSLSRLRSRRTSRRSSACEIQRNHLPLLSSLLSA